MIIGASLGLADVWVEASLLYEGSNPVPHSLMLWVVPTLPHAVLVGITFSVVSYVYCMVSMAITPVHGHAGIYWLYAGLRRRRNRCPSTFQVYPCLLCPAYALCS